MMIFMLPVSPASSPVPESGITVTVSDGSPRVMVPLCCRMKVPVFPCRVPLTRSIATYPAEFFTSVPPVSISPLLVPTRSPRNCLSIERRPSGAPA